MHDRTYDAGIGLGSKFGFNGQQRSDEVYGKGNLNTALFWEYDTRLGRRWNVDPRSSTSMSSYSVFGNNPIFNSDVLGDTFIGINARSAKEGLATMIADFGKRGEKFSSLLKLGKVGMTFSPITFTNFYHAYKSTEGFPDLSNIYYRATGVSGYRTGSRHKLSAEQQELSQEFLTGFKLLRTVMAF